MSDTDETGMPEELESALVTVLDNQEDESLTAEQDAALQRAVEAGEIEIEDVD